MHYFFLQYLHWYTVDILGTSKLKLLKVKQDWSMLILVDLDPMMRMTIESTYVSAVLGWLLVTMIDQPWSMLVNFYKLSKTHS